MPRTRTTSASVAADRQTDANDKRPLPVTKRGRGKKRATEEASAQDVVVANRRTDADTEIAELKGMSTLRLIIPTIH
jgi:hypothetical protein